MTSAEERSQPAQTLDDTVAAYLSRSTASAVSFAGIAEDGGVQAYLGLG